jgi:phytoene synthase
MIDRSLDPDESRAAYAAARDWCRKSDGAIVRAAYGAAFFLPREKRRALHAIAAFGSLMRQALAETGGAGGADGCCSSGSEASGVAEMVRSRVEAAYAGRLELPLPAFRDPTQWTLLALSDVLRRYEIPRSYYAEWIDGLVADAGVRRYATWNALKQHANATGGSAAVIASCVLGLTHSDVGESIRTLGVGARLTAILQSLRTDAAQGRIYLPQEDLARFHCTERDLTGEIATGSSSGAGIDTPKRAMTDAVRELVRFEVDRARKLFADGSAGVGWLAGDGSRLAAAAFVALQTGILDAIERARFDPFAADVSLPLSRQLRQLPAAWRLARRRADEPMPHAS